MLIAAGGLSILHRRRWLLRVVNILHRQRCSWHNLYDQYNLNLAAFPRTCARIREIPAESRFRSPWLDKRTIVDALGTIVRLLCGLHRRKTAQSSAKFAGTIHEDDELLSYTGNSNYVMNNADDVRLLILFKMQLRKSTYASKLAVTFSNFECFFNGSKARRRANDAPFQRI